MQAEISPELLEELRRRAREQGRTERELLDEAVKSYLERPSSLAELFDGIDQGQHERGVAPLSEDDAMRLAVEEQHAWRRERRSTG
jgi:hypothetical protein